MVKFVTVGHGDTQHHAIHGAARGPTFSCELEREIDMHWVSVSVLPRTSRRPR